MNYDRGDQVTLGVAITDRDKQPADPTALRLLIRAPGVHRRDAELRVYDAGGSEIEKVGIGEYESLLDLDETGRYSYRWEATGEVVVAEEGRAFVRRGAFEPASGSSG